MTKKIGHLSKKKSLPLWLIFLFIISLGIIIIYVITVPLTPKPSTETFDFAVSINPESRSIQQGESVQVTVTVTLLNGTSQTVTLSASDIPSGASATFNLSSGNPTFTDTLTITTTESTPIGNYTITITGTGGELVKTANYTLTITAKSQPFDFSVSVSPDSGSVQQGNSTTQSIMISLTSGSPQSVSLSISGLPSGASASLDKSFGDPTFTDTMTISTSSTTPAGTYIITVTASGGNLTKTATYTLTVTSLSGSYMVTFTQTGLPNGTVWSVTFGGTTRSLTGSSITFAIYPGSYDWNVSSQISGGLGIRFVASLASGSMDVPSQTSQSIIYTTEYELTISINPLEAGLTTPDSGSYWHSAGSEVSVSASPLTPFAVSLLVSDLPNGASGSFSPLSNGLTFTSTLTVTAGDDTALGTYTVTVSGSKSGYSFGEWMLDENSLGSSNPITITMNSSHSLVATFIQPSVQIDVDPTSIIIAQKGSSTLTVSVKEGSPEQLNTSFTYISVVPYIIRVYTIDVENYSVSSVSVTLGSQTKTTNSNGYIEFYVAAGTYTLTVPSTVTIWHQHGSPLTTYADSCPFYKWDDESMNTSKTITVSKDLIYTATYKLVLHFAGSIKFGWEYMAWPPFQIHYFFETMTSVSSEEEMGHVESTRGTVISGATVTAYFDISTLLGRFYRSDIVTTDSNGHWFVNMYAYDIIINLNRIWATASKDSYVSASWSSI